MNFTLMVDANATPCAVSCDARATGAACSHQQETSCWPIENVLCGKPKFNHRQMICVLFAILGAAGDCNEIIPRSENHKSRINLMILTAAAASNSCNSQQKAIKSSLKYSGSCCGQSSTNRKLHSFAATKRRKKHTTDKLKTRTSGATLTASSPLSAHLLLLVLRLL